MNRSMAVVFGGVAGFVLVVMAAAAPARVEGSPAGSSVSDVVDAGKAIYDGKGNCFVCHGPAGKGTPMGPDLTDGEWLTIDGSRESIVNVVRVGVPKAKAFPGMMPPMGGAKLSDAEIGSVADYVMLLGSAGEK